MKTSDGVLISMLVFLAAVAMVCAALLEPLRTAFLANEVFNSLILAVLFVGIIIDIRQVLNLKPELRWLDAFRSGDVKRPSQSQPRMLAPMARILSGRHQEAFRLSAMTMRSLLDGIRLRLDEHRDVSRYLIGLLIFLGLLGTFWGLLDTITAVGKVIAELSPDGSDVSTHFAQLQGALQEPLAGMGTAFSSSLFGLGGALVLGFLDLQAGHAQNRFFNHLEEWLSELTHLPSGMLATEGETTVPRYIEALLEQTADGLHSLQRIMARGEDSRLTTQSRLLELTEKLAELSDQMRAEEKLISNLAKGQLDMQPAIRRIAENLTGERGSDEEVRGHIRNMAVVLNRLLEELSTGRTQFMEELRGEIRLLTRTLAQRSETRTPDRPQEPPGSQQ
ncbi:MAG: flagellar motor protein MotA [Gammaproteobacteria bacterium]